MDPTRRSALVAGLRAMFPAGSPLPGSSPGSVLEVREADTEAVVLLRWERDPRLYGIPIDLTDTRHEYYYDRHGVQDDEEWFDSVGLGLMVALDTGLRARSRRRQVGDYIELGTEDGWPTDDRFYFQQAEVDDVDGLAEGLMADGLDPTPALTHRSEGRVLAWLLAYENNATGCPWLGHALVVAEADGSALLHTVETVPNTPDTLRLDLAYFAAHMAAEAGAMRVTTSLPDAYFATAGFEPAERGRVLDTSFLAADPDAARRMLEADLAAGSPWGRDRDCAGRHLPESRAARVLHALRHGPSGLSAARHFRVG